MKIYFYAEFSLKKNSFFFKTLKAPRPVKGYWVLLNLSWNLSCILNKSLKIASFLDQNLVSKPEVETSQRIRAGRRTYARFANARIPERFLQEFPYAEHPSVCLCPINYIGTWRGGKSRTWTGRCARSFQRQQQTSSSGLVLCSSDFFEPEFYEIKFPTTVEMPRAKISVFVLENLKKWKFTKLLKERKKFDKITRISILSKSERNWRSLRPPI